MFIKNKSDIGIRFSACVMRASAAWQTTETTRTINITNVSYI